MRRALGWLVAVVALGVAVTTLASAPVRAQAPAAPGGPAPGGRQLFLEACSSCHGEDARGVRGRGPSLRGSGARAADFYLATGRMPLAHPSDQPRRAPPAYDRARRRALVAYLGSLGGPGIPRVDLARGSLSEGRRLFAEHCASCHQVVGRGGVVPPAGIAPALQEATPTQVAEAVRVGPYTMPPFSEGTIGDDELASIARYVDWTKSPDDRGGWGIGNIGPVPEGVVAWLLAGLAVVLVARMLGERTR